MFRYGVMILSLVAISPAHAQSGTAGLSNARAAFSGCLGKLVRDSMDKKMTPADFQTGFGTNCTVEEAAYKAQSISADVASKVARAAAERNANDDISDMRANALERYKMGMEAKPAAK